ncbi:MAG: ABC transporter ATP-binding protein [Rubrivivax sp.]|nr:ABC transporter ATP-binding protein [Rubrivivax sp.]
MSAAPHPLAGAAATGRLELDSVVWAYGSRTVLQGVSTAFAHGWTALVGPNGAGKSSLLRVAAGLLTPQAGTVRLDGQALHGPAALSGLARGRRIAWLSQGGEITGELTLRETVALGRLPHLGLLGAAGPADEAAIERAMAITECQAWQHRRLSELSGGERQRGLLARALASEADVLLLDEPTTHLDPPHQIALARLARQLAATHTVVTVMHDLSLALAADRVLLLEDGRIRADAPAHEPALHEALCQSFGQAIRIRWEDGRAWVQPQW